MFAQPFPRKTTTTFLHLVVVSHLRVNRLVGSAELMVDPKSASPDELILVAPLGFNFTTMLGCGFVRFPVKDVKGWDGWVPGMPGRRVASKNLVVLFCEKSDIWLKAKPKKRWHFFG